MRKALGTSVRTACYELRKVANHHLAMNDTREDKTDDDDEEDMEGQLHGDSVDGDQMETASNVRMKRHDEDSEIDEDDEAEDHEDHEDDDEDDDRCPFIDDEVEESDDE
jgi:hypothetical protein